MQERWVKSLEVNIDQAVAILSKYWSLPLERWKLLVFIFLGLQRGLTVLMAWLSKIENLGLPLLEKFSMYTHLSSFSTYENINEQKSNQWL